MFLSDIHLGTRGCQADMLQAVNCISETVLTDEVRRGGYDGIVCGHIHAAAMRDIGGSPRGAARPADRPREFRAPPSPPARIGYCRAIQAKDRPKYERYDQLRAADA
jgi:hypothetical protein